MLCLLEGQNTATVYLQNYIHDIVTEKSNTVVANSIHAKKSHYRQSLHIKYQYSAASDETGRRP